MEKLNFNEIITAVNSYTFDRKGKSEVIASLTTLSDKELKIISGTIESNLRTNNYETLLAVDKATAVKGAIDAMLGTSNTSATTSPDSISEVLKLLETVQVSGLDNVLKLAKAVEILKSL